MADSITEAIDRGFDLVDSVVAKIDHVLNRGKSTGDQHRARRARQSDVIDATSSAKVVEKKLLSSSPVPPSTALAVRRFRIVESIDASSGKTVFVVTNGGLARAECSTRDLADKILLALEAAS